MKLYIKEKVFSWGDKFTVNAPSGSYTMKVIKVTREG
mgnify:CR=1 FL=1